MLVLVPGPAHQSHQLLHSLFEWSNIYKFMDRMGSAPGGQSDRYARQAEAERQVGIGGTNVQMRLDADLPQAFLGKFRTSRWSSGSSPKAACPMASNWIATPGFCSEQTICSTCPARVSRVAAFSERRSSSSMASAAIVLTDEPPEMMPTFKVVRG